jgi:methylmalonyl-CoA mutase N-terminal domain/subunit
MASMASKPPADSALRETLGGIPLKEVYGPADATGEVSPPGQFPWTRGIHADMYRGRLWTMRQFSGFASPEETNLRYKYLLAGGANGLSVAFDLPTLMGCDSDDAKSEGEVGKCGVAIDSIEDMETLFAGIPLDSTTVSMTINSPASVLWAMYLVVAERQGADWKLLSGTLQNDILKEYIAQKEYLYPPAPRCAWSSTHRVWRAGDAAVQSHFDFRLPHSRSRIDRAAGAGLHAL